MTDERAGITGNESAGMAGNERKTTQMTNSTHLEHAISEGLAEIVGDGRGARIRYAAADRSERWTDPEEKVRAELWAELVYKYGYPARRVRFEVAAPRRTPNDFADLVIYADDELKRPYFVFECKRGDVSDAEFEQAIEQACGNRASLGAAYCGAVSGRAGGGGASTTIRPASATATISPTSPLAAASRRSGAFTRTPRAKTSPPSRARICATPKTAREWRGR